MAAASNRQKIAIIKPAKIIPAVAFAFTVHFPKNKDKASNICPAYLVKLSTFL